MKEIFKGLSLISVLLAIFVGLSACNSNDGPSSYDPDPYPNLTIPHYVQFHLESDGELAQTAFSINQLEQKIFNAVPLSYGFKLDSAYLKMNISSRVKVEIENLTTKGKQRWQMKEANKEKIEVKGGKLSMTLYYVDFKKDIKPVTYLVDLNVYTYDPNKIDWKKQDDALPVPISDASFLMHHGERYLLGLSAGSLYTYKVNQLNPLKIETFAEPNSKQVVRPHTIKKDYRGQFWGISKDNRVLRSEDLKTWLSVQTDGVIITAFLYDLAMPNAKCAKLLAVGKSSKGAYGLYYVSECGVSYDNQLYDDTFPIRDMLVYSFETVGVRHANVFGGYAEALNPNNAYFFTSDGREFGKIDFRNDKFIAPVEGATLMKYKNNIYMVGGAYPNSTSNKSIYLSVDRGATWVEMTEKQGPDAAFDARMNPAGTIVEEDGYPSFYIVGGMVNNQPTTSYWRGAVAVK